MSYLFDLDPVEQRAAQQLAESNPAGMIPAPWYEGLGTGIMSGAKTAAARQLFAATTDEDTKRGAIDEIVKLKPDPRTVGTAGQLLFGLADQLLTLGGAVAGGDITGTSAAIEAGTIYADTQAEVLMREGVDQATARSVAAVEGGGVAIGALLPASVTGSALARVASGAAINTAMGGAQRQLMSSELSKAGYGDLAKQYEALDAASILTDVAIGGFFGGVFGTRPSAKPMPKVTPSDLDATLTMGNAAHAQMHTMPGMPKDFEAPAAHAANMNKALDALMKGDDVSVDESILSANFAERPVGEVRIKMDKAILDHLGPEWARLDAELQRRGLATDDIDKSGFVTLEQAEAVRNAAAGGETSIKIEGQYQPAQWAIVDARQVEATMDKAPNQFRDRFRAASQAQIEKISNAPDFNLLSEAPLMDFGAPTLTKDGMIVGGNGRFAGVSRAYSRGKGEAYRAELRTNIERFGLTEADLAGKEKPVLVRILKNDVDVQRTAIASNEGAGMRMSALEQAKVDSVRLGEIAGMKVGENGEINLGPNLGYIRQWAGQFPETEQASLVDKNGRLSQEGEKRLRNAILFRAYGDSPTLERLVESTDPGARNVATALIRTAPKVAEVKAAIEAGELYPLDISDDISAAVEKLDAIRSAGDKVADYLNQGELLGSELTPEARTVLQFMSENLRSAKAMSEMIGGYYERVEKAGNPSQGDMLGGEPPTKGELLAASIEETKPLQNPGMAELPFMYEVGNQEPKAVESFKAIEQRFQERVDGDFEALVEEYAKVEETEGGRVMNTDLARELSPEYRADRSLAEVVHEPSSEFVKKLYREKLAGPTPDGKARAVLFLGGGGGSGKSSGLAKLGDVASLPELVYDTTLAKLDSAQKRIQEALDAGREARVVFTVRDPIEAFYGVLKRAMDMEAREGSGRPVPLKAFAEAHPAARANIDKLAEIYANDPRVEFIGVDNTRGRDKAEVVPIDKLPLPDYNKLEAKIYEILQAERPNLSDAVYRGTLGDYRPDAERGSAGEGAGGQPKRDGGDGSRQGLAADQPAANVVNEVLAERPDLTITDENGQPMLAAQALAQADAEITSAMKEAPGFDAAVTCALRNS